MQDETQGSTAGRGTGSGVGAEGSDFPEAGEGMGADGPSVAGGPADPFATPGEDVRRRTERIVAEGQDIRNRVRVVVEDAARTGRAGADHLNAIAREVVAGAMDGLKNMSPERRDQALREAVDGLGDGMQRTAEATRAVIEGAARRGERFAREDLDRLRNDLQGLGDRFVETVSRTTGRAADELRAEIRDIRGHAEDVLRTIRPSLRSAAEATTRTGGQAANSAASTGAKAGRAALGALFGAVGSVLTAAGEAIAGAGEQARTAGRGERPGTAQPVPPHGGPSSAGGAASPEPLRPDSAPSNEPPGGGI